MPLISVCNILSIYLNTYVFIYESHLLTTVTNNISRYNIFLEPDYPQQQVL